VIDAAQQRTRLVDDVVRVREDLPFLEVLRKSDLKPPEVERVARDNLLLADDRCTVQRATVGAAGVAQEHAAVCHPDAGVTARERWRVDDEVAGRGAADERFTLTQRIRCRLAAVDEP
jgi:hypothetical protein